MTARLMPFVLAGLLLIPICAGAHPSAPLGYDPAEIGMIGVQIAMGDRNESACLAGAPPDPVIAADFDKRAEARLAQYFERIGSGDHGSVTHLFIDSGRRARWTGPEGAQSVEAIADPVGAQRANGALTRKLFLVGGDNQTARGVWVLTLPAAGDPSKTETYEYGVDFKLGLFGGVWIWHMHLYRAPDTAPPPPERFCHIDPEFSY